MRGGNRAKKIGSRRICIVFGHRICVVFSRRICVVFSRSMLVLAAGFVFVTCKICVVFRCNEKRKKCFRQKLFLAGKRNCVVFSRSLSHDLPLAPSALRSWVCFCLPMLRRIIGRASKKSFGGGSRRSESCKSFCLSVRIGLWESLVRVLVILL